MKKAIALLVTISILVGVSGCALGDLVSQAPRVTPTPSRTPKPTFTPLVTETPIPEATPTATNTSVVVPTDTPTPTPSSTAMPTATNTLLPPPTPTSPPSPPTATSTPTPTPVIYRCTYVQGPEKSMAGKPGEGQPCAVIEGYVVDTAGNGLNNYGIYYEHASANPPIGCVITGYPTNNWAPGFWKHERYCGEGQGLEVRSRYYITIKKSCDPGAPALSIREDFLYSNWDTGHHKNIIFRCSF